MAIMRYTACPFYRVPETVAVTVCPGGWTLTALLPVGTEGLRRAVQLSRSQAADLSALPSVPPSFKTSVPFLPEYF